MTWKNDLEAARVRANAEQSADWVDQYGDEAWNAAMAQIGAVPFIKEGRP